MNPKYSVNLVASPCIKKKFYRCKNGQTQKVIEGWGEQKGISWNASYFACTVLKCLYHKSIFQNYWRGGGKIFMIYLTVSCILAIINNLFSCTHFDNLVISRMWEIHYILPDDEHKIEIFCIYNILTMIDCNCCEYYYIKLLVKFH